VALSSQLTPRQQKLFSESINRWYEHPAQMVRELFKVEPDAWQEEVLERYRFQPRTAMPASKGPGKGLTLSTLVETPRGPYLWGELQEGDLIFGYDGVPTTIIGAYQRGVQPIYRITFDDGSFARVDLEHLWNVQGATERRKDLGWVTLSTKEIIERGVRVKNGRWSGRQFAIPRQMALRWPEASSLPIDPYLLGVWLGDGTRNVARYAKPYIEVENEIRRRGYKTSRGQDGMNVDIVGAAPLFRQLDCFDTNSWTRFVPFAYKYASIEQRRDLVCGLMDTDGCIGDDSHMEFATTSLRLANDMVWLVRSLGGVALIKEKIKKGWYRNEDGEKVECRDCYRVTPRLPFNPFRIAHKVARWRDPLRSPETARYMTRYISSIEPDGQEETMCVAVDHPSHLYLANDFIVTHNTTVGAWVIWNFLLTRPFPNVACTSVTSDNLRDGLWKELAKWRAQAPILQLCFRQRAERIESVDDPEQTFCAARTWDRRAALDEQAQTLAGFHSDYVLFFIDEAGSIPDAVSVAAEAALSTGKEAHLMVAGNTLKREGPLFRACTAGAGLWFVVRISGDPDDPKRSPRVSLEWARAMIAQYGRDHPWVKVNVFGEFPDTSIDTLIGPDEMEAARKRSYTEADIAYSPRILGIDVARQGDDESCMAARQGLVMFPFQSWRNIAASNGAGFVSRKIQDWDADACFVDNTGGFGSSWIDQLRLLGRSPIPVEFAGEPNDRRFYNKRTEMYWELVRWIKEGGQLPECPELVRALTQITYTHKGDRMLLEPKALLKERIQMSPDHADAAAMTFAQPVAARIAQNALRGGAARRYRTEYDPYAYETWERKLGERR
jgi:hypothetical protein